MRERHASILLSIVFLAGLSACGIGKVTGEDDDPSASAEISGAVEDLEPVTVDAEVVSHAEDQGTVVADAEVSGAVVDPEPVTVEAEIVGHTEDQEPGVADAEIQGQVAETMPTTADAQVQVQIGE